MAESSKESFWIWLEEAELGPVLNIGQIWSSSLFQNLTWSLKCNLVCKSVFISNTTRISQRLYSCITGRWTSKSKFKRNYSFCRTHVKNLKGHLWSYFSVSYLRADSDCVLWLFSLLFFSFSPNESARQSVIDREEESNLGCLYAEK